MNTDLERLEHMQSIEPVGSLTVFIVGFGSICGEVSAILIVQSSYSTLHSTIASLASLLPSDIKLPISKHRERLQDWNH